MILLSISSAIAVSIFIVFLWIDTDPTTLIPKTSPVSPFDGKGMATITPDFVTAGQPMDGFSITFTVGDGGIAKGGRLDVVYPGEIVSYGEEYRAVVPYPAERALKKFRKATVKATTNAAVTLDDSPPEFMRVVRLYIGFYKSKLMYDYPAFGYRDLIRELGRHSIRVREGSLKRGDTIKLSINWENMRASYHEGWTSFLLFVDGDGDGAASAVPGSPRVVTSGSKAAKFNVIATSAPKIWDVIKVTVVAVDPNGELDQNYSGTVYLDSPDLPFPGQTEMTPSDLGRKTFRARAEREGVYYVVARDSKGHRGKSNPIVVEERGMGLYWGDPHMDSVMGMGSGVTEYAYRLARDHLGLDFACVSLSDSTLPFDTNLKYPGFAQSDFAWGEVQQVTGAFDQPERFAALTGFEWGSDRLGHRNVYYSPDEADTTMMGHANPNFDTVEKLLAQLKGHKAIVSANSTALKRNEMDDSYHWGPRDDSFQRLVEVYNAFGASEFYGNPRPVTDPFERDRKKQKSAPFGDGEGAYVREALANGYKLGMIAGGDRSHDMFGRAPYSGGLTAVWAPAMTSRDIWNSFYSRHVYATTGARIFLRWTVGGSGPGNDIAVDLPVEIGMFVVGTAKIAEAQLVKYDGEYSIAKTIKSDTESVHATWQEWNPPANGFYILRIVQEDGQMAWAGPIWVRRR